MENFENSLIDLDHAIVGGTIHPTNQGCPGEEDLYDDCTDRFIEVC